MIVQYKGKKLDIKKGTKVLDIIKQDMKDAKLPIIACKCNNEVKNLDYEIQEDTVLEIIDYTDKEGKRIYVRGIMYIMSKALSETYPNALLTVNYQLSNSMFCELDNMEITDEIINNIKIKMQEIIDKDLPIKEVLMTPEEAEKFYEKEKTLKGIVQMDSKYKENISLYFCEEYYNYFFGVMPISTGYTKIFDIVKYRDGFLVRYPSKENPDSLPAHQENKKLVTILDEYEDIHKILGINTIYKLNKQTKKDNAKDCILLDEALHEKKIANIADSIAKRKDVKVILIAGPSSSGKTTFANRLGIQLKLNGLNPVTLSVDNYFVEREQTPNDELGNYDFECIEAIDLRLFNEHLLRLIAGEEVELPTFDFKTGHKMYKGNTAKLNKGEVLVIEGIHCLNDKLTNAIVADQKYKIYISALTILNIDYYNRISTTDTRLIRRIVRDNQFRNYSALHTMQMWYSVNRGERANIFPYQEEADSMFNSSLVYELGVLKDYAVPLLEGISKSNPEYSEARRLLEILECFESIPIKDIPETSLLREFIGGSVFEE